MERTLPLQCFQHLVMIIVGLNPEAKIEPGCGQDPHQGRNGRLPTSGLIRRHHRLSHTESMGELALRDLGPQACIDDQASGNGRTADETRPHTGTIYDRLYTGPGAGHPRSLPPVGLHSCRRFVGARTVVAPQRDVGCRIDVPPRRAAPPGHRSAERPLATCGAPDDSPAHPVERSWESLGNPLPGFPKTGVDWLDGVPPITRENVTRTDCVDGPCAIPKPCFAIRVLSGRSVMSRDIGDRQNPSSGLGLVVPVRVEDQAPERWAVGGQDLDLVILDEHGPSQIS